MCLGAWSIISVQDTPARWRERDSQTPYTPSGLLVLLLQLPLAGAALLHHPPFPLASLLPPKVSGREERWGEKAETTIVLVVL